MATMLILCVGYSSCYCDPLYGDNTSALSIASDPIFHEWTKIIEFYCHLIRD